MSATDYRVTVNLHPEGFIGLEVTDGQHLDIAVYSGDTLTNVRLDYSAAGELFDRVGGAVRTMLEAMTALPKVNE